jgi:uncharacterized protein YbdZ (MbtH family)
MHGSLVWKEFNAAVLLSTVIRQGEDQTQFKNVLWPSFGNLPAGYIMSMTVLEEPLKRPNFTFKLQVNITLQPTQIYRVLMMILILNANHDGQHLFWQLENVHLLPKV